MTKNLCRLMFAASAIAGMQFLGAPAMAMTKAEAQKECQALYGGRANYNKRTTTGMTVQGCVNQKMGDTSKKKK